MCGARTSARSGGQILNVVPTSQQRKTRPSSFSTSVFFFFSLSFLFPNISFPVFDRAVPRQPNYSLEQAMTNVSAGAKRSWEGHHPSELDGRARSPSHSNPPPYKRQRGREEGRGWREEKQGKRESRDRREYRSRERERDRDRNRERERDRDRDRERERERDRERDPRRTREHSRDRERHNGREREYRRRDDERRRTPVATDGHSSAISNGRPPPPQRADSDKEEGE